MSSKAGAAGGRPKLIPTNSKWVYSTSFKTVYESERLKKEELVQLSCRRTHCVRLQHADFKEDAIHTIFARQQGQSENFMRKWLHFL